MYPRDFLINCSITLTFAGGDANVSVHPDAKHPFVPAHFQAAAGTGKD
jgi:hypothetical protein